MPPHNRESLPDWAAAERGQDLAWIRENLAVLWPAAQVGYQLVGRGAVVVDAQLRPNGEGLRFGYLDQAALAQSGHALTRHLVRIYEPRAEFVTMLLKSERRVSSYCLRVLLRERREGFSGRINGDPEV
ncbi:MAG: hypothetical protein FOGNACKC_02917 [Anaerolineae bacterium]|nr:hypothetical protein [Anaerolineae bacterium]